MELDDIDLILTDPPYSKESLYLFKDLRDFATKALKPSGFLIFYISQSIVEDVLVMMSEEEQLHYYWTFALKHKGNYGDHHPRNIHNQWKPIIMYQKNPIQPPARYVWDYIEGTGREKEYHPWQQSVDELEPLIKAYSKTNDTILDPFAGTGSTCIAAMENQRKSILIEKDKESIEIIKGRIAKYLADFDNISSTNLLSA